MNADSSSRCRQHSRESVVHTTGSAGGFDFGLFFRKSDKMFSMENVKLSGMVSEIRRKEGWQFFFSVLFYQTAAQVRQGKRHRNRNMTENQKQDCCIVLNRPTVPVSIIRFVFAAGYAILSFFVPEFNLLIRIARIMRFFSVVVLDVISGENCDAVFYDSKVTSGIIILILILSFVVNFIFGWILAVGIQKFHRIVQKSQ